MAKSVSGIQQLVDEQSDVRRGVRLEHRPRHAHDVVPREQLHDLRDLHRVRMGELGERLGDAAPLTGAQLDEGLQPRVFDRATSAAA